MRPVWLAACALLATLSVSLVGRAQNGGNSHVAVEVVEIAGGRVYVSPGESAGIRRGGIVTFGDQGYPVIAATSSTAILDLGKRRTKVGARGTATVSPNPESGPPRLPPPQALAAWSGQWPAPELPSASQHPKAVPLGPMDSGDRTSLVLSATGAGIVPLSGSAKAIEHGELRARVRYEPFHELPVRFDADIAAQVWLGNNLDAHAGDSSRRLVRVRELQAAYGEHGSLFAALGRLRYASRTLGMLDGARVEVPVYGGITLGAFGGFVPDPLDGKQYIDTTRFGAELGFEDLSLSLRPRMALTAQGSHFDGALDERKLTGFVELFPGDGRVSSYVELSLHDGNNPWHAPAQEISAAGADAHVRLGVVELGGRLDLQRPERSRWLASFLPPGWLCITRTASPSVAGTGEPCYGNDARYSATGSAGLRFERFAATLGTTLSTTEHADARQLAGFLNASLLRILEQLRLDGSLMASTGSIVRTMGAGIGVGSTVWHGLLDVSVHYRPALISYRVDNKSFVEHTAGTSLVLSPSPAVELSLNGDVTTGRDFDVLLVQTMLAWRPPLR